MNSEQLIIKGAREHNLQNVSLTLPKQKLIVFTGVSGSGKSSLAFDTIYAEGQRRYVESLSAYARQFLGIMNKPDVDFISGLSPSISIDQKTVSRNPRSTVGTITEIYDYLRLLFSKVATSYCHTCGVTISRLSIDEISRHMLILLEAELKEHKSKPIAFTIQAPIARQKKGEFASLFRNLVAKGYNQATVDGKEILMSDDIALIKTNKHDIDVQIETFSLNYSQFKDRIFKSNLSSRLFESIEAAGTLSDGLILFKTASQNHLFSQHFACPNGHPFLTDIEPRVFSFNSPLGACQTCKGLGKIVRIDISKILNMNLTITEGAILPFNKILFHDTWFSRLFHTFLVEEAINTKLPLNEMNEKELQILLHGNKQTYKVVGKNRFGRDTSIYEKFDGVVGELEKKYAEAESEYASAEIERYMTDVVCTGCDGKRLRPEVLTIKIEGFNIYELSELSVSDLLVFINELTKKLDSFKSEIAMPIVREIISRLNFLSGVGLAYLNLNRGAATLSGGESQRIRLASQIGSGLSGVIYVLDEPSIGLHPTDVSALLDSLIALRDLGNTIIVVEHDRETILKSDYIVDFGPLAGKFGGKITFTGNITQFKSSSTLTAQYLFKKKMLLSPIQTSIPTASEKLELKGCRLHNLKGIDVSIPLQQLTCITGVSGSGKSSLVVDTLYPALKYYLNGNISTSSDYDNLTGYQYLDRVYVVDQSSIGKTPRSNPATYLGIFDTIRDLFADTTDARMRGYKKGRFSFNVRGGRCEKCLGAGTIKIEMQFLSDVYVTCDVCSGKRYNSETLEVKFKGMTIFDVLQMTVEEALSFFGSHPKIVNKLSTLYDVGLSYIELGQPAPTLSGGEAQRIKLANELCKQQSDRTFYILDEPTTGLHMYDVEKLTQVFKKLVKRGNTIVVIEHNIDIIAHADYIIDLGPGGGDQGGKIIYQGDVAGILKEKSSLTAKFLQKELL